MKYFNSYIMFKVFAERVPNQPYVCMQFAGRHPPWQGFANSGAALYHLGRLEDALRMYAAVRVRFPRSAEAQSTQPVYAQLMKSVAARHFNAGECVEPAD